MEINVEDIIDEVVDDFEYQIKQRGKEYYNNGNVKSVVKSDNTFRSKVLGSNGNKYNVTLEIDEYDECVDYECDCPYEYPCKHIYATMLAIKDKAYLEIELKPEISENSKSLHELIEEIPADKLKEYLLSEDGNNCLSLEIEKFEIYFSSYLPRQEYEYYYNNMFNALVTDDYNIDALHNYLLKVKNLILKLEYEEAFDICKSIIEASFETGNLNKWDDLIDSFPVLGMNLRIIYRKSNSKLKNNINEWIKVLKNNNYYDSLYLEDIILTIK